MTIVLFLVGCSNVHDDKENVNDDLSFEESLQEVMIQNDFNYDAIIDYDVKGNFIYIMAKSNGGYGQLAMAILKKDEQELQWIMGEEVSPPVTSLADKGSPVVTVIKPRDYNVKQVKVFGEPVKSITYYDDVMENYSEKIQYWIAYTDEPPGGKEDIEYMKE